jgi:hypothetical protein
MARRRSQALRSPRALIAIAFAVFVFLGVSALLARALSATGSERAKALAVARAEARGDADEVLKLTPACARDAACAAATRAFAGKLARAGEVEVLQYRPSVQLAMTRTTGTGRLAWRAGTSLPVVQCFRVRREGPLTGGGVEILSVSPPIGGESSCP